MENQKIRVGITQGDINGIGYEVILKTFAEPMMCELCTPIIYGSPKVAAYHRKALDLPTNFSIVNSAADAQPGKLSIVNCSDDEVKVELSKADPEAGKAALSALERALEEYRGGLIAAVSTSRTQLLKATSRLLEASRRGMRSAMYARTSRRWLCLMVRRCSIMAASIASQPVA